MASGSAGAIRQQAGDLQAVARRRRSAMTAEAGGLVPLPGTGVDEKDVLHKANPPSIE